MWRGRGGGGGGKVGCGGDGSTESVETGEVHAATETGADGAGYCASP